MPISVARHDLMRRMNEMAVLTVLRQHGPLSRRRIAQYTGLTKSTVTVAVQRLFAKNILMEVGTINNGPGRPEVLLNLNPTAGYIIGAGIDVASYHVVLFDLEAHILQQYLASFEANASPREVLSRIAADVKRMKSLIEEREYWGFGLSIPSVISTEGDVIYAPNLKWADVPVKDYFVNLLGEPVFVLNDADAGAVAEYFFGEGQKSELLVYLTLGMGIGGGIVVNGDLLRGTTGASAEVGHMVIAANGPLCSCGRRGCFEALASVRTLIERATRARDAWEWLSLDEIVNGFSAGEAWAVSAVNETVQYIAEGVTNIANIYDPDMIVLGGPLARLGPYLEHYVQSHVSRHIIAANHRRIAIKITSLGQFASDLGAGAMVLNTAVDTRDG
ncbi:MAG: ROK family transcriptional regulator [Firmicutes bacterium]|nr:ROK family transcriptional regulator [Bacillota bacterium]